MNRRKVARELLKIAKSLTAFDDDWAEITRIDKADVRRKIQRATRADAKAWERSREKFTYAID